MYVYKVANTVYLIKLCSWIKNYILFCIPEELVINMMFSFCIR